ncbi:hypothetical protein BaRGS_00008293 [Batillaria attramentaria]|uniref:Uncharacterized protein n=1 Tax=Batillaria attramentaria TaxID=370345 RepID=A0ABD0LMB6_9CAEN
MAAHSGIFLHKGSEDKARIDRNLNTKLYLHLQQGKPQIRPLRVAALLASKLSRRTRVLPIFQSGWLDRVQWVFSGFVPSVSLWVKFKDGSPGEIGLLVRPRFEP